jgi:hypothetical protein
MNNLAQEDLAYSELMGYSESGNSKQRRPSGANNQYLNIMDGSSTP